MARTPKDWREMAQSTIEEKVGMVADANQEYNEATARRILKIERAANLDEHDDGPDPDEVANQAKSLQNLLIEMAHEYLDLAKEINKLHTGPITKNLRGKEPTGYSKRDGGATTDAVYGSQSMVRSFQRHISWPLNLDDWDKTEANMKAGGEYERVSAAGVKKYRTHVGGRTVSIVMSKRDPPI